MIWTAEMLATLQKLVENKKFSYEAIAKRMTVEFGVPFTKNSCIGKGRRIGLAPRTARMVPFHTGPILPQFPPRQKDEPVTMERLRYRDCRWPLGRFEDRPPYLFCGKLTISEGCSWCAEHFRKAHTRSISDSASLSRYSL